MRDRAALWSRAIRLFAVVLPGDTGRWTDAARAELFAITSPSEQRRFALSSMRGLLAIAIGTSLRRWASHARALWIALALGMGVALFDVQSDNRSSLKVGLLLSCVALGIGAPGVSRVSGLILGLSLPLLTSLSGHRGPYEADVGDVWIPLLPALAMTSATAWLSERYLRRRSK